MSRGQTLRIAVAALLGFSAIAMALPTEWKVADGGNGHFYEAVSAPFLSWGDANAQAQAKGGYLVTLGSAQEDAFVYSLVQSAGLVSSWVSSGQPGIPDGYPGGAWIGLQKIGADWKWVTGETFSYSNWFAGQPDGIADPDLAAGYHTWGTGGTWHDSGTPFTTGSGVFGHYKGFVVESVPEPGTALTLFGIIGLLGLRRARRQA